MGTVVFARLDPDAPDSAEHVRRLADAGFLVTVRSGDEAAAALDGAGVAHVALEERGLA